MQAGVKECVSQQLKPSWQQKQPRRWNSTESWILKVSKKCFTLHNWRKDSVAKLKLQLTFGHPMSVPNSIQMETPTISASSRKKIIQECYKKILSSMFIQNICKTRTRETETSWQGIKMKTSISLKMMKN